MTGDQGKAKDVFQDTVREAAFLSANGDAPPGSDWFFREARWRCLAATAHMVQPEVNQTELAEISEQAPEQIAQLEPGQLAVWISAAPEPQRSALALYYLDHFDHRQIMAILGLKLHDLANALALGRREFQAWLNATTPVEVE
jgi:DNA-directed RNA polymerase specialized sigma24 family protein